MYELVITGKDLFANNVLATDGFFYSYGEIIDNHKETEKLTLQEGKEKINEIIKLIQENNSPELENIRLSSILDDYNEGYEIIFSLYNNDDKEIFTKTIKK